MKTLIVYYSLTGNTAWTAQRLAALLEAETLALEPEKAYPKRGLGKFFHGGKSAVFGEAPALKPYAWDPSACSCVVFGFPVWAGRLTPPLRTFIQENREVLAGKTCAAFACQSGSGAEKALADLKKCLNAEKLAAEAILIDPKDRPQEKNDAVLRAFAEKLLPPIR